mmetsp:Transcript_42103/g.48841  ORF Transcript_42103/g.48841 Transcript_42103/m.48841 type:complete len:189 (-) Transcript_42103:20-586(-)
MLIKFAKKNKSFRNALYSHDVVDKVMKWLKNNPAPPVSLLRGQASIFKNAKKNQKPNYQSVSKDLAAIKDYNTKRRSELNKMFKEPKCDVDEPESEDDLYEQDLEPGHNVDVLEEGKSFKWVAAKVLCNLGEVVKVHKSVDQMEVDEEERTSQICWINKDSSDLAPYETKTISMKAIVNSVYTKAFFC